MSFNGSRLDHLAARAMLISAALAVNLKLGCEPPRSRDITSVELRDRARSPLQSPEREERALFVYVASSLAVVAQEVTERYRAGSPQRRVHLVITSSQSARLQLERGAPSGVFISATSDHIERLTRRGRVERALPLAENPLTIVTRNALDLKTLADLDRAQRWGMGDPSVPIGDLGWSLLKSLESWTPQIDFDLKMTQMVKSRLVTQSLSARALRGRVNRGEVDAAVIYSTDLRGLRGWRALPLPSELTERHRARYVLALTRADADSDVPQAARDWCELMFSPRGQASLQRFHFISLANRFEDAEGAQRCRP